MKFSFAKRCRVACDAVLTGALIVGAHACEDALEGDYNSALEACYTTLMNEARVFTVLVKYGRGNYTTALLTRSGFCKPIFDALNVRFVTDAFVTFQGKPITPFMSVDSLNVQEGSCFIATPRMRGGVNVVQTIMNENYFANPLSVISKNDLLKTANSVSLPWEKKFSERAKEFDLTKGFYDNRQLRSGKPAKHVEFVPCPKFVGAGPLNSQWMSYVSKAKMNSGIFATSQRMSKYYRKKWNKFDLQSDSVDLRGFLDKHVDEGILSLAEDLMLLCVQLLRANSTADRALAITVFIKLRTGTSLLMGVSSIISDIVNDVNAFYLQADDSLLDKVTDVRSLLANWMSLQESALVQQIMKVYKYAVAVGVFSAVGIKIDEKVAYMCRKEMSGPLVGPNFIVTLMDTVATIVQRALLFKETGKWSTFFHGPATYGKWFDDCQAVKRQFAHKGDLESLDTNYHRFIADLNSAIETGTSILKYGNKMAGGEILSIKKLLNEMLMIKADLCTYNEAQKSRRPPFGLLLFGKTCVAKSTFTEMLFQFMGRVMDLPTGEEFKYSRNPCDDFWSGWDSMKWFVVLDDVGYVNPAANQTDNSLMEIIQIVNDVALVPNQASLDDKGKNPMRARAVVATTNVKHLNAHAHFACPIAVQRRLPFVVTAEPKPQYARDDDADMIDPAKLPAITDSWPDFWHITVERVVAAGDGHASFCHVHKFLSIKPFLAWLATTIEAFNEIQARAGAGCEAMRGFTMCPTCKQLTHECVCEIVEEYDEVEMQAREYVVPDDVVFGEKFVRSAVEGDRMWVYEYTPHASPDGSNYMLTTRVFCKGKVEREFTAPINLKLTAAPALQSDDIAMAEVLAEIVRRQTASTSAFMYRGCTWAFCKYIDLYARSRFVRNATHAIMRWKVARKLVLWGVKYIRSDKKVFFEWCGNVARDVYVSRKWKYVLGGIATATTMIAAYSMYTSMQKSPAVQGLRVSVEDSHFNKTESENVWKRDDYETSSFDKTPLNVQYAALPYDQVNSLIMRNVARIMVSNGERVREGNAFCPCGHLWFTNNHSLFDEGDLTVTLAVVPTEMGAGPNVVMKLRQVDIKRYVDRDLACFEVHCWETKRDLRGLVRKPTLAGEYTGSYVGFGKNCSRTVNVVKAVSLGNITVEGLNPNLRAWHGWSRDLTVKGDCGMPLVVHKPVTAILGLHTLGNKAQETWATAIDSDIVDDALKHYDNPVIQCAVPVIDAPSKPKSLGPLRQWSPLRWLEKGSLLVYGSYLDRAVTSRSKVRPTLLGDAIKLERGWTVDFGVPQLRDWRPWRHALVDVTQQQYGAVSPSKLRVCAQAFVDDIVEGLTPDMLSQLQVLSDKAAINGIDGVKFIDKMNFKSSMGEPYNTTKKTYLRGDLGDKRFDHEVEARIARILRNYNRGQRACPVFSGKLKDEARAFAKIAAGKIRVFTGAPADWSFVTRKYLLPLVKLIQENPMLFEASPGCTVQSIEWEQYFDFLTFFGVDRIVAGDYGKFDKKMEALLIKEAFWILAQILKAAGWSESELITIFCIGEDVAYSYVNFDGDLVQFFGSNPSGQPLTVIVNCIVNALYMRYAYLELSPMEGTDYEIVRSFKRFVHLLTYGDDNTMGISKSIPWFNHTEIQRIMASIGVEYTMADKESVSRPYIHIREVAYLKRTWRWDEDVGAVVCPLDVTSIHKMLTICNPSDTDSPELHMASVMSSALNEWFWYGRKTFEKERAWLWKIAEENDLTIELVHKGFPTWDALVVRFWNASAGKTTKRLDGCEGIHPRSVLPN